MVYSRSESCAQDAPLHELTASAAMRTSNQSYVHFFCGMRSLFTFAPLSRYHDVPELPEAAEGPNMHPKT